MAPAPEPRSDRVRVVEVAQVVHARQLGTVDPEPARPRTGRDQGTLEGDPLAALEDDLVRVEVKLVDRRLEAQLDVVLGVEVIRERMRLFARRLAAQVVLRERRAFVRKLRLVAEEDQPAVVTPVSKRLGGLCAGESATDYHEGMAHFSGSWLLMTT